jgi:DNA-binding MarR family transcriptional regulator
MSSSVQKKESLDIKLKTAWHLVDRKYNHLANQYDLSSTMALILLTIDPNTGTPVTKIGPALGLNSRGLSRLFDSLEEKKLIKRKTDKSDARKSLVTLTSQGIKRRELLNENFKQINQKITQQLGEKKTETLIKLLNDFITIASE